MIYFLVCLGACLIGIIILAIIARYKKRDSWFWAAAGFIGDMFALVVLHQLPEKETEDLNNNPERDKNRINDTNKPDGNQM